MGRGAGAAQWERAGGAAGGRRQRQKASHSPERLDGCLLPPAAAKSWRGPDCRRPSPLQGGARTAAAAAARGLCAAVLYAHAVGLQHCRRWRWLPSPACPPSAPSLTHTQVPVVDLGVVFHRLALLPAGRLLRHKVRVAAAGAGRQDAWTGRPAGACMHWEPAWAALALPFCPLPHIPSPRGSPLALDVDDGPQAPGRHALSHHVVPHPQQRHMARAHLGVEHAWADAGALTPAGAHGRDRRVSEAGALAAARVPSCPSPQPARPTASGCKPLCMARDGMALRPPRHRTMLWMRRRLGHCANSPFGGSNTHAIVMRSRSRLATLSGPSHTWHRRPVLLQQVHPRLAE